MNKLQIPRRDFLKFLLAGIPALKIDWDSLPQASELSSSGEEREWDALIIGAGLGGLSCAAAFARQGFKPLIIEQHTKPGGYATTFSRQGGFIFDVSLHSMSIKERNGIPNLIPGFPEIEGIKFVPHKVLYRAIFPEHDIRVEHRNVEGYILTLEKLFPQEKEGIQNLFLAMKGLVSEVQKYSESGGKIEMSTFPRDYPYLMKSMNTTWGNFQDAYLKDPKLKAIVSSLWGYFGLPPSKLSCFYYVLPLMSYLEEGGYYPLGCSQKISDAFVDFIEKRGGKVVLRSRVERILVKDRKAYGVRCADGNEYRGKVIISNANVYDTFHKMIEEKEYLRDYLARMETFTPSLSSFQVFLGLSQDLVKKVGIEETEIFYEPGYDLEESYHIALNAEVEKGGFGLTLYDNLYEGYSPKGKNTLNIITLQGYDHWKRYEADYFAGKKEAYRAEKQRMAEILIKKVEEILLPGLSKYIDVKEIGTPLTNVRYTSNYHGAVYGWDQTVENSEPRRLPHKTPIRNLYLAGAWTRPGGGYTSVISSGLQCFAEVMKEWKEAL